MGLFCFVYLSIFYLVVNNNLIEYTIIAKEGFSYLFKDSYLEYSNYWN